MASAMSLLPGFGITALIGTASAFVSTLHGGPQLLYALFFGVAFHHLSEDVRNKPGIEFCSRWVLRLGVGILGARITTGQIAELGWFTVGMVSAGVVSTFAVALLLSRWLKMNKEQGVLSGAAVAICGASAALAVSAVLPRRKESDQFTLVVVVTVTVMSTIAMVVYPLVARAFSLPPALAGLFIGGTIHDVAQVVGAGYILGAETGDVAVVVKLFRVALLSLVVIGVSTAFRNARAQQSHAVHQSGESSPLVPWFLWLFVLMVATNSLGLIPPGLQSAMNTVSRECLVLAISAIGLKTSFAQLAQSGWKPLFLILSETLWLAGMVLLGIVIAR